jgi:hypothetical protein
MCWDRHPSPDGAGTGPCSLAAAETRLYYWALTACGDALGSSGNDQERGWFGGRNVSV